MKWKHQNWSEQWRFCWSRKENEDWEGILAWCICAFSEKYPPSVATVNCRFTENLSTSEFVERPDTLSCTAWAKKKKRPEPAKTRLKLTARPVRWRVQMKTKKQKQPDRVQTLSAVLLLTHKLLLPNPSANTTPATGRADNLSVGQLPSESWRNNLWLFSVDSEQPKKGNLLRLQTVLMANEKNYFWIHSDSQ